jgi:hypothetical protein
LETAAQNTNTRRRFKKEQNSFDDAASKKTDDTGWYRPVAEMVKIDGAFCFCYRSAVSVVFPEGG